MAPGTVACNVKPICSADIPTSSAPQRIPPGASAEYLRIGYPSLYIDIYIFLIYIYIRMCVYIYIYGAQQHTNLQTRTLKPGMLDLRPEVL